MKNSKGMTQRSCGIITPRFREPLLPPWLTRSVQERRLINQRDDNLSASRTVASCLEKSLVWGGFRQLHLSERVYRLLTQTVRHKSLSMLVLDSTQRTICQRQPKSSPLTINHGCDDKPQLTKECLPSAYSPDHIRRESHAHEAV